MKWYHHSTLFKIARHQVSLDHDIRQTRCYLLTGAKMTLYTTEKCLQTPNVSANTDGLMLYQSSDRTTASNQI